ncbi:MAG: GH3 auxin-responsive promoter family protein [Acidobacteria bacterium]|nr:GH3 auxin-responsive promoter family protein [Acidobacteriota bacterium]
MTQTCRWINRAWRWLGQRQQRTFERDLLRPKKVQAKLLFEIVQANCQTDFGKQHGFERIKSVDDYQRSVPLTQYDDYVGAIDRIRTGNRRVLTRDDVTRLVPTSGSTNAVKWIPMTKSQLASFKTLANLWMADIFTQQPEVMAGPAYWSISPAITMPDIASAVPLGFEDDAAYGGWLRPFIQRIWPVPSWIQHAGSDFQELTLLHLLQAHQLSLVSVWHPSFFSQLCEAMVSQWDHLMMILREGKTYHVHGRSVRVKNMAAAKRLGQRDPNQPQRIWPQLAHISCWADGHARGAAEHLHTLFPKSRLVPKGILATEACVSLPFQGCWPLALFGAFFEFMDEKDQVFLAHQLEEDKAYSLIITTRGGLYRYRMFDQVRVTGFLGQTPSIRFNGKTDHTSDLVGEKLNEAFVADAMRKAGLDDRSVLAPVLDPPHYRLLLGSPTHPDIGHHLDLLLSDNPYYAQARNQGQLKPLSVKHIDYHPQKRALSDAVASNRVRGGVKVLALAAPEPH